MKQVININFQGRVVPIEVSAYEILKRYTESLNHHFAEEEGRDEIINDIENRIGELFHEKISQGATCITDEHVQGVIRSMGNPEEFDDVQSAEENARKTFTDEDREEQKQTFTQTAPRRLFRSENDKIIGGVCGGLANYFGIDAVVMRILFIILAFSFGLGILPYIILWIVVPSSSIQEIGAQRKKLYRDTEDKFLGGVCSGLGHYFGVQAWIPRLLFLLPLLGFAFRHSVDFGFVSFGFGPGAFLIYIILWVILPEAKTTSDKLEMRGEKVDLNSIKNSVMQEMRDVQGRAEKFGKDFKEKATKTGQAMSSDINAFANRNKNSFGNVISTIVKVIAYFILGIITIVLIVVFFSLGLVSIAVFPMKDFMVAGGWQNILAWATLLFFIILPILGLIIWTIRKLMRTKRNSRLLNYSFGILWTLGWVCFFLLIALVGRDFKSTSSLPEQTVELTNPTVNKLIIKTGNPLNAAYYRKRLIRFTPFSGMEEDTLFVKNTEINIIKSPDTAFHVTVLKIANGSSRRNANEKAEKIDYKIVQFDSLLITDRGVAINKTDKFRNQRIMIAIFVPEGKEIRIERGVSGNAGIHFGFSDDDDYLISADAEENWDYGTDYIMRADGLYTLDGTPASSHRYRKSIKIKVDDSEDWDGADETERELVPLKKEVRDSLKRIKKEIEQKLKNIEKKIDGENVFLIKEPRQFVALD